MSSPTGSICTHPISIIRRVTSSLKIGWSTSTTTMCKWKTENNWWILNNFLIIQVSYPIWLAMGARFSIWPCWAFLTATRFHGTLMPVANCDHLPGYAPCFCIPLFWALRLLFSKLWSASYKWQLPGGQSSTMTGDSWRWHAWSRIEGNGNMKS